MKYPWQQKSLSLNQQSSEIQQPVCINKNAITKICIDESCRNLTLLCSQDSCIQCNVNHQKCERFLNFKLILRSIINNPQTAYLDEIMTFYRQLIQSSIKYYNNMIKIKHQYFMHDNVILFLKNLNKNTLNKDLANSLKNVHRQKFYKQIDKRLFFDQIVQLPDKDKLLKDIKSVYSRIYSNKNKIQQIKHNYQQNIRKQEIRKQKQEQKLRKQQEDQKKQKQKRKRQSQQKQKYEFCQSLIKQYLECGVLNAQIKKTNSSSTGQKNPNPQKSIQTEINQLKQDNPKNQNQKIAEQTNNSIKQASNQKVEQKIEQQFSSEIEEKEQIQKKQVNINVEKVEKQIVATNNVFLDPLKKQQQKQQGKFTLASKPTVLNQVFGR